MDINIPVSGAPQFQTVPTASTDFAPVKLPQPTQQAKYPTAPQVQLTALADEGQRQAIVQQAAQTFSYPLGDKSFTIFKDATGQYITRYVSLRDGSITYIPEPNLVKHYLNTVGTAHASISA